MQEQTIRVRRAEVAKKCTYCDRTFTKEEHLKRHQRSHTGEKPFKCHRCHRRYGRSDVLVRHLQTHLSENHPGERRVSTLHGGKSSTKASNTVLPITAMPALNPQYGPNNVPLLSTINNSMAVESLNQVQPQEEQDLPSLDSSTEQYSAPTDILNDVGDNNPNGFTGQENSPLPPLSKLSTESVSRARNTAPGVDPDDDGNISFSSHTAESRLPNQQITQESRRMEPVTGELELNQNSSNQDQSHATIQLPFIFESDEVCRFQADGFQDVDFNEYDYFSPGMIDFLDFATPREPLVEPHFHKTKSANAQTFLSVEQTQEMRRLWRGQRLTPGVRFIWSLWSKVAQHAPDNIFSKTSTSTSNPVEPMLEVVETSKWGVDNERRRELINYCEGLYHLTPHTTSPQAQATPPQTQSESESESGLPGLSADGFLTKEVLETSLDFFFQYFPMPFVHKATFNAATTPDLLLFPICLIGFSFLYPERSKPFILRHQKNLMRSCRRDLASKALGNCQAWELLVSIASTLLVVYLALGLTDEIEECQAHMLCVQMLHIVEKHGFFAAYLGDDLTVHVPATPTSYKGSWNTWARIESIKRMISYLLWVDAAYTRIMGSAGVVDMDKVEVHIPCEAALFDATSLSKFSQAVKRGAAWMQPRMRVQNFQSTAPPAIDHVSMQTLISSLYLQAAAARHGLPGGNRILLATISCSPAEVFVNETRSKHIITSVLLLPAKYASIFQSKDALTMVAWNNLCINLTTDLDLLEVASGRDGLDPAHAAMIGVTKWSRSASARRAIVHASQIFSILSSSRLRESNVARSDLLLFVSALVLSMYLFVVEKGQEDHNSTVFELLQEVNWTTIGDEGLRYPPENIQSTPSLASQDSPNIIDAARDFIRHGGPVSFAGEDQLGGATAARKILLNYVHLLDEVGKWRWSRYSQLLRTMSNFLTED